MKILYRIDNGLGSYFVIAEHPTEAQNKLKKILDDNDYGFSSKREVISITPLATEIDNEFLTGKFLVL